MDGFQLPLAWHKSARMRELQRLNLTYDVFVASTCRLRSLILSCIQNVTNQITCDSYFGEGLVCDSTYFPQHLCSYPICPTDFYQILGT
jgi:hypothetical protein